MNSGFQPDYPPAVERVFAHFEHAGSLTDEQQVVWGSSGSRSQGVSIRLWLKVGAIDAIQGSSNRRAATSDGETENGRIVFARFEAYGCPYVLAALDMLCGWLEGRTRAELELWNWREAATELHAPPEKRARLLAIEDALQSAARAWDRSGYPR